MSLAERRWLRLFTLCVLYVAQGIPWGFMATTLPAYLAKHGVKDIGAVMAMTTLPYSFKWIWGPIIDAFTIPRFGRRPRCGFRTSGCGPAGSRRGRGGTWACQLSLL